LIVSSDSLARNISDVSMIANNKAMKIGAISANSTIADARPSRRNR